MLGPLGKSEQRKSIDDTLDSKRHSVITKKEYVSDEKHVCLQQCIVWVIQF